MNEEKETKEATEEVKETTEESAEASEDATKPATNEKESAKEVSSEEKEEKKEAKVSGKLSNIIKSIEELTVLELNYLVKALEDKFGVTAAAPVAITATKEAAGEAATSTEEGQTTFNVVLVDAGSNKISVIKVIRELVPTLGLKEAKDLVDAVPKPVLEGVGKDIANEAKQKLEAAGGKVELR